MDRAEAIKVLNFYRNCHYTEVLGTEERELADAINAILPHYAALREQEQSKWISVKERLPEDVYGREREQIVVLVCTKSGKVSQCARMADYECIADETLTKVEWVKNGKFYWSKNKAVTHWMPLPEPPKEGADHE